MATKNEWLHFFSTVHASKGVFKQPQFPIHDFLETGERDTSPIPTSPAVTSAPPPITPAISSTIMVTESQLIAPESLDPETPKSHSISERETSVEIKKESETIYDESNDTICDKGEDPEFIEKLQESLGFLKQGLPPGTTLRIAILYAINLIKPADGKEELWFDAIKFDEEAKQIHIKLTDTPQKIKYLKEGSVIKPTLEKVEKFFFSEDS